MYLLSTTTVAFRLRTQIIVGLARDSGTQFVKITFILTFFLLFPICHENMKSLYLNITTKNY